MWVVSFGLLTQFVYFMQPGRLPLEFHLCAGSYPEEDSKEIKINVTLGVVYVVGIVINVVVPIKIRLFQIQNHSSPSLSHKTANLTDLTTSMSMVLLLGFVVASLILNVRAVPSNLNVFPNYVFTLSLQVLTPNLITLVVTIIYFLRHEPLRITILRLVKDVIFPG